MSVIKPMSVVSIASLLLVAAGSAQAGSGCLHQYSAELEAAKTPDPLIAAEQAPEIADAKWLALLKKQRLDAENTKGSVVIHN